MAKKVSLKQYEKQLKEHNFNWFGDIEMSTGSEIPAETKAQYEKIEDSIVENSLISRMHSELYDAYLVYATMDGPKPRLVEAGKENGKIVYKIIHDNKDGLIFDWRKQHVRI